MRNAECGIEGLGVVSIGRIPGSTSALQFRIPHFAFRIGLVDWFNAVDATYRTDLRELNDLNFARFEAKLGERLASLESHLTWRMFAFWAPTPLAVIGTGIGVISLLLRR